MILDALVTFERDRAQVCCCFLCFGMPARRYGLLTGYTQRGLTRGPKETLVCPSKVSLARNPEGSLGVSSELTLARHREKSVAEDWSYEGRRLVLM